MRDDHDNADSTPSREELLKALTVLPQPVLTVSQDGRILYLSAAASQHLKLDPQAAAGQLFPYSLAEGRVRELDLDLQLESVDWGGEPCRLITLMPSRQAAFRLEWRLESAEEAAREAEARSAELETEVRQLRERTALLQAEAELLRRQLDAAGQTANQRMEELESLLELADERLDEAVMRAQEAQRRVRSLEELDEAMNQAGRSNDELAAEVQRLELEKAAAERQLSLELVRASAGSRNAAELQGQLARALELLEASESRLAQSERAVRATTDRAEDAEDRLRAAQEQLVSYQRRLAQSKAAETDLPPEPTQDSATSALRDELTRLPTTPMIQRHLELTLQRNARYGGHTALLWVDLDRFKVINDAMGVRVGDELLKAVASRLESVVRGSDVLGRRGEDEFLILLPDLKGQEDTTSMASAVARRIYEVLAPPFSVLGQKLYVSASIGISLSPGDSRTSAQLIEHAEAAMLRAKELGRGRYQFYTPELQLQHEIRQKTVEELRQALDRQQFRVVYQPVVDLKSGRMVGVEALLRWEHPARGLLEPEKFLSIAEDTGMIVPIGRWVILQACEQSRTWTNEGHDLFTFVNLSARQVLQADLGPVFARTLDLTGAIPSSIVAELSETAYDLDPNRVDPVIQSLRDLGIRLAIDRFGTGSSSLERLGGGHLSFLKVDRKLTARIPADRSATGLVLGAIGLARSLRLTPVVVGVENDQQKNLLKRIDCELVQGNFLAPALPAAQISRVAGRTYA